MHPHVLCQWDARVCRVPFVLPLSFSLAVAGTGRAQGQPCPLSEEGVCPRAPAPLTACGWGGAGSCQEPAGSSRRWWMWSPETLRCLPGRERRALSNPENCNCSPLSVQGKGRMLPWRLSMALLNQADRFWLLLSLCWFFFLFFFFSFPTQHPKHFQPLA